MFTRRQKSESIAIGLTEDRITVARVRRQADRKLALVHCRSYRKEVDGEGNLVRLKQSLGIHRAPCVVLLNAGEYQLLPLERPAVAPHELKSAIRWQVKDLIDYPADEATVDVLPIPEDLVGKRFVFAVCAANSVIQGYVRQFQAANVPLEVIDIQETAQRNVAQLFESPGRGVAMVSFGQNGSLLTISGEGELYFARRIELTLPQLTGSFGETHDALRERLLVEVQRSLDNFDRQFPFVNVAKLLVAPLPETTSVHAYLAQNLYLPVESADLRGVMDLSAVPELDDPVRHTECLPLVGAALRNLAVGATREKPEPAREPSNIVREAA